MDLNRLPSGHEPDFE